MKRHQILLTFVLASFIYPSSTGVATSQSFKGNYAKNTINKPVSIQDSIRAEMRKITTEINYKVDTVKQQQKLIKKIKG